MSITDIRYIDKVIADTVFLLASSFHTVSSWSIFHARWGWGMGNGEWGMGGWGIIAISSSHFRHLACARSASPTPTYSNFSASQI